MHVIINGREAEYDRLTAKPDGELLLKDRTRYTFDLIPLWGHDPLNSENNLIEVASFAYSGHKWMLGEHPLYEYVEKIQTVAWAKLNAARAKRGFPAIEWRDFKHIVVESRELYFGGQSEKEAVIVEEINSRFFTSDYVRRWGLAALLRIVANIEKLKREVSAAAWFEGNCTPVLLRSFSEIKTPQSVEAEAKLRLTNKKLEESERAAPELKLVSRFKPDFDVAIIVEKTGTETPLTIEPELGELIKRIVEAGGHVPRTKLRNGKTDTYQPEKLFDSKAAQKLVKAKLLGKKKSGRTTVFWAKQQAG